MKAWLIRLSIASAVSLAISCGDDDSSLDDGHGGAAAGTGNEAGASASDAGGAPGATCEPPTPHAVGNGELGIVGEYKDNFDSTHVVTASSWTIGDSVYHISAFDDEAGWLVARNDEGNDWSPCLWSRFDWTELDSKLYLCQTAFDAESEEAALAADAPDPSNPATTGCASFPWSELIAQ